MKISGTNETSKCMYCGSPNYGKGCQYSPNGTHFHSDDGRRCGWCGSTNIGVGCPFNPVGKMHQRGYQYTPLVVEAVKHGIIRGVLMSHLNTPVTELPEYKAGLIDENYNKLRNVENIVEAHMMSPTNLFVHRLVKVLGSRKDLINTTQLIESRIPIYKETRDELATRHRNELDYKDQIKSAVKTISEATKTACTNGLSPEDAEKIIAEMVCAE